MTDKLPANLLALFAPRPPLRYIPPSDRAPDDVKPSTIGGVAQYVGELEKYAEEIPYNHTESWLQRKARLKKEKKEKLEKHLTEGLAACMLSLQNLDYFSNLIVSEGNRLLMRPHLDNPANDPQVRGDAFKTLFVARLSYDVKEADLEREFGRFGPIERVYNLT
jgi:U1 small nuclear ribonucleoprotein